MNRNDIEKINETNEVKITYQLDSQSKKTLERLSSEKIKQSMAVDIKIFENHKLSIKG